MLSKYKVFFVAALVFLFIAGTSSFILADTGTYRILDYTVKLTPRSDGKVEMTYYQKWQVTGGHIPWITIGTANSNFQIDQAKNKGNIRSISDDSSGTWQGVKIELDRDYKPNETFEVEFTLIQSKLFYADEENFKLDFTPGWYDRCITDQLVITMHLFAKIEDIKTKPVPTKIEGQEIIWIKKDLGRGQRFSVSISFPKKFMPDAKEEEIKGGGASAGTVILIIFIVIVVIAVLVFVVWAASDGDGYGGGGTTYYGGSRGSGGSGSSRSGRSSGGGGGFGGRSVSCACACVSCACACACAGGGGAGCDRKSKHFCPVCKQEEA